MAFEIDESGRSFYAPAAFFLSLRAGVLDMEVGAPTASGFPVFMHEYAHFLQDTTTTYGILNFLNLLDVAQDVMRLVDSTAADVPLPLASRPDAEGTWLTQHGRLLPIARPLDEWPTGLWTYARHAVRDVSLEFLGEDKGLPVVAATFVDNVTGDEIEHAIGAREIKEAYSQAVEWLHEFGREGELSPDQFEYHAVERVIHARLGSRAGLRHTIVLCHWALQSPLPGVELFRLLEHLDADAVEEPEALYDRCRALALENGLQQALEKFHASLAQFVEHRRRNGDVNGFITAVFEWYRGVASKGMDVLVDGNRRFPLDTFLCATSKGLDEDVATRGWTALLTEFPGPVVQDQASGQCFTFGDADEEAAWFARALSDLVSRLRWGHNAEWACPLADDCVASIKDASCEKTPWQKGTQRPTCSYGAAAVYLHVESRAFASSTKGA